MTLDQQKARLKHFSKAVMSDLLLYGLVIFTALVISGAATFYHHVEGWSWLDSFYFAVITISTVGYGDLSPHTVAGKLFTIFYILIGIGLFVSVTANVGSHLYDTLTAHKTKP
ncbi:hypothetical protein A4G19_01920 [Pasteurellaceae bacterium Macca]|nr:hypothetical protein [Pasteurellaceae bacterium Macca]